MTDRQTDSYGDRDRERKRERGEEKNKREKEGNRRRDSVEQEVSGRRESNSDTPLRETEGVIN